MLDTLQRLSARMRPAAPALGWAAVLLLLGAAALLLVGQAAVGDELLLPVVVAMLWCLCGYLFIRSFETVPERPDAGMGRWQRFLRRLARAWHWLLALAFVGITIAALSLTNRIVGELLR
jgi:fatty acid desaturase